MGRLGFVETSFSFDSGQRGRLGLWGPVSVFNQDNGDIWVCGDQFQFEFRIMGRMGFVGTSFSFDPG